MKQFLVISAFILVMLPVFSQNESYKKAVDYLEKRGEVYFSFKKQDPEVLNKLSKIISIDRFVNDSLLAYANQENFEKFLSFKIDYNVLPPPCKKYNLKTGKKYKSTGKWDYYPTYNEYIDIMESFADSFPEICLLDTIGYSINNRKILFLKISDNPKKNEAETEFMYTSTMHGDETIGYIMLLRLIEHILHQYNHNPNITYLVDNMEIWINPLANPDGTYFGGDSTVNNAKRYNLNNVDLNRNFPDPEDGLHPDGHDWQPENIAMMNFLKEHHFVLSANLHTGGEVINYPWDTWEKRHADDQWFEYISRQYADTVHKYAPADYLTDLENGVTNGFDWYSISGGRQDYITYFLQGREVTMELGHKKSPPAEDLSKYWEYNYRSLINFMQQGLYGIKGFVKDSITGDPLHARIYIPYYDTDSSMIYSDSATGFYQRLLYQDIYELQIYAADYPSKQLKNITVHNMDSTRLDVSLLQPIYPLPKKSEKYSLSVYPNPFCNKPIISIGVPEYSTIKLTLYDNKGRKINVLLNEYYSNGFYEKSWDVSNLSSGMYILHMKTDHKTIRKKVIKINATECNEQ